MSVSTVGAKSNSSRYKIGEYPCKVEGCDKIFETAEKRKKHKYAVHTAKG